MNELLCHAAFDAPLTASGEMMFMPAGSHTITPSQAGKAVKVTVLVTPAGAQELEAQRAALEAKGKRPYFDFNHEDGPASFWPTAFYWKEGAAPGIYCRGEWSDSGRTAVEGKEYRQFSPVFHVDNVRANPAKIAARDHASPNMGGLVNAPAFSNILPFWAKNADGAHSITTNQNDSNMTPQELAALQAKNTELQTELDALKSQAAKDQNNAALAAALSAKESELKLSASVLENETLKAKNADLVKAENDRRSADADKAIADAVNRTLDVEFGLALQLLAATSNAQWMLVIEHGSAPSQSSPATTAMNLENIEWEAVPLLAQRLILTGNRQTHSFGARIKRSLVSSADTITADTLLYGIWSGANSLAPATANFALRARLVQFDTENALASDARAWVAYEIIGATAGGKPLATIA